MPSGEVREALPEADMLVNLSNDAWFGDSLAPHQHLQIARLRARDGAAPPRATNGHFRPDGPRGELLARSRAFEEVVVTGGVTHDRHDPLCPVGQRGRRGLGLLALGLVLSAGAGFSRGAGPG